MAASRKGGTTYIWSTEETKMQKRKLGNSNLEVSATHIAIQERLDGKVVEWMEKVSDEQFQR
jgi:hypothetical protein